MAKEPSNIMVGVSSELNQVQTLQGNFVYMTNHLGALSRALRYDVDFKSSDCKAGIWYLAFSSHIVRIIYFPVNPETYEMFSLLTKVCVCRNIK